MSVTHEYVFLWRRHRNNPAKMKGFSIRSSAQGLQIPFFFCSEIPVTLLTKSDADNYRTQQLRRIHQENE